MRRKTKTGAKRGRKSRLTPAQIRAIRLDERVYRLIAADYGVSAAYICQIRKGVRQQAEARKTPVAPSLSHGHAPLGRPRLKPGDTDAD